MEESYNNVLENIRRISDEIAKAAARFNRNPKDIRLMAVTKTVSAEFVNLAVESGITLLGESKAQEMLSKYDDYSKDGVDIHFIGHLQTNKVKSIIGKVSTIQSVDSLKLAREISKQSVSAGCVTQALIEINIGGEESKGGISPNEAEFIAREISVLPAIKLCGLMTIPPFSQKEAEIEQYFSHMNALLVDIRGKNIDNVSMDILSMGMSGDYIHAIKHGANILRIGTAIFGSRR